MNGYSAELPGGISLKIASAPGLFSPAAPDAGTLLMLSHAEIAPGARVLDLGCGCGIVGAWCAAQGAEVTMLDIDPAAVSASRLTLEKNGLAAEIFLGDGPAALTTTGFDLILTNPPYHSDFSVAKHFIEKGFNRLRIGGRLMLVVKRELWYANKIRSVFGGFTLLRENGYCLFTAERRTQHWGGAAS